MAETNLKKQQIEYIGIALLVVVALIIGITKFKKKDKVDEVFSRAEFNRKWKEVEILEVNLPKEEKTVDYVVEAGKTPFESPLDKTKAMGVEEIVSLPQMTFQGMVWNSLRPQAIINNKVYDINDTIILDGSKEDQVKITNIVKDGIYLQYKGRDFIVRPK